MPAKYLHEHKDFPALLRILAEEMRIDPYLIEKDYWIMHVLRGLQQSGYNFELKGGTSLSKGFRIIDRFSEDIDIHIKPPDNLNVQENPARTKAQHITSRKNFYDWLAAFIQIDGIHTVNRDYDFDDTDYYRSGGIRLFYKSHTAPLSGVKEGILLEAGFDTITPNSQVTISSWAYDRAIETTGLELIDNRAIDITCYHPGYTFVEKLQTIATKFRQEMTSGIIKVNFMRQYYDVYCLLANKQVQAFIGTDEYQQHKIKRFPKADLEKSISENEAFLLSVPELRDSFRQRYITTTTLYYKGQPDFDTVIERIKEHINRL